MPDILKRKAIKITSLIGRKYYLKYYFLGMQSKRLFIAHVKMAKAFQWILQIII
jgi:hypothetical protein